MVGDFSVKNLGGLPSREGRLLSLGSVGLCLFGIKLKLKLLSLFLLSLGVLFLGGNAVSAREVALAVGLIVLAYKNLLAALIAELNELLIACYGNVVEVNHIANLLCNIKGVIAHKAEGLAGVAADSAKSSNGVSGVSHLLKKLEKVSLLGVRLLEECLLRGLDGVDCGVECVLYGCENGAGI